MILFPTFKGLTINVHGLSEIKFLSIVDCFHRESLDFCFVQETMISDKRVMNSFCSRWRVLFTGRPLWGEGEVLLFFLLRS